MAGKTEYRAILIGDVGATKAHLAVISRDKGPRAPLAEETLSSAGHPSMEALLKAFLKTVFLSVERACIGVSGPVIDGRARITNLL